MDSGDPRFQPWAYLTDGRTITEGHQLFEVISQRKVSAGPGYYFRLIIENCSTLGRREVTIGAIRRDYTLVKETPKVVCPDLPEDLVVVVDDHQGHAAENGPAGIPRAAASASRFDRPPVGPT